MCSSQDITEGFFQLEPNQFLYLPSKQACLHSHIQLRYQNWVCKKTCPADALRNADNQIIENSYGQNTRYFKKKKKKRKEAAAEPLLRAAGTCRNTHS